LSSYRNALRSVKELSTQYQPKPLEEKQPPKTLKSLLNPNKQPSSKRSLPKTASALIAQSTNCTKAEHLEIANH
jgi:hypothetical protein